MDFDIESAVEEIGSGMGFEGESEEVEVSGSETVAPPETQAPTEGAAPASTPAAAAPTTAPATTPAAEVPPVPGSPVATPPRTWKPDAAAEWAKIPPRVQEEIHKREQDMWQGLESYKGDAAVGKAVTQIFKPFEAIAQQDRLDPGAVLHEAFSLHTTLSRGSEEQKLAALSSLATRYGLTLPSADPDSAPYVDPQVARLQEELRAVKSQMSGLTQQQQEAVNRQQAEIRTKLEAEVEAFSKSPENADFDMLSDHITQLLKSGQAKDLRSAYDQAVWLHPVTRQKAIDSAAAARAEAEKKAQSEAAAKAKAATSANVRTQAKNASGTAASTSMDDTMNEAYEKIMSRSK